MTEKFNINSLINRDRTSQVEESPEVQLKRKEDIDTITRESLAIVIDEITLNPDSNQELDRKEVLDQVKTIIDDVLSERKKHLSISEKQRVANSIMDEIFAYGPITPYLNDPAISEVMVNGYKAIYVEKRGRIERVESEFRDNNHVLHIIDKIIAPIGRRVDESSPMVDGRLPDGSRVNVIIPPLAIKGPSITIRKFATDPYDLGDLIGFGTLNQDIARLIKASVRGRINIIVSGGTGSGKTTLLNVLSSFIPGGERIVTIEDAAELQLQQDHVVTLESRPPNIEGRGQVTIRDLVINSLRMRPDRIIVGEVRGGETLDMLQAMNTGHDGSITTVHANNPRDTLSRLETMVLMAGMDLPSKAIREQISSALNLIVQCARFTDGSRKITSVTEIVGMEGDTITLQDIFKFQQEGFDEGGNVVGAHVATGIVPSYIDKLQAHGESIPTSIFKAGNRFSLGGF